MWTNVDGDDTCYVMTVMTVMSVVMTILHQPCFNWLRVLNCFRVLIETYRVAFKLDH